MWQNAAGEHKCPPGSRFWPVARPATRRYFRPTILAYSLIVVCRPDRLATDLRCEASRGATSMR